ncbi:Glycogen synthase [Pseudomonas syringae pv. actinidiae]|uniref:Glycogen synthase n=1 Tax=Pseudomonas syringae pv. actinidiae TaxID=103796 RepID=A0AAN4Q6R5_PSESF|nr:Glycogen synthase [Pseudomonas syringae pv. actinidiae]
MALTVEHHRRSARPERRVTRQVGGGAMKLSRHLRIADRIGPIFHHGIAVLHAVKRVDGDQAAIKQAMMQCTQ